MIKPPYHIYPMADVMILGTAGSNVLEYMLPELVNRNIPLTAETYQNDIKDVTEILEDAVADGFLTETQKKRVLDKMEENLAGLE